MAVLGDEFQAPAVEGEDAEFGWEVKDAGGREFCCGCHVEEIRGFLVTGNTGRWCRW